MTPPLVWTAQDKRFIPWSPGASWKSFLDGDPIHHEILTHGPIHEVTKSENDACRADFIGGIFDRPLGDIPGLPKQVDTWWWDQWSGRTSAGMESRHLRWEVYDECHRRWTSAMAQEQLVYSFRSKDDNAPRGKWYFDQMTGPMLLMTGEKDEVIFANIHTATETLARRAIGTDPKGNEVTIPDTGHSIHDERPQQLAAEIHRFLSQPPDSFST